jgi:hypothetical protein
MNKIGSGLATNIKVGGTSRRRPECYTVNIDKFNRQSVSPFETLYIAIAVPPVAVWKTEEIYRKNIRCLEVIRRLSNNKLVFRTYSTLSGDDAYQYYYRVRIAGHSQVGKCISCLQAPFGSFLDYCYEHNARPLFLIKDIILQSVYSISNEDFQFSSLDNNSGCTSFAYVTEMMSLAKMGTINHE